MSGIDIMKKRIGYYGASDGAADQWTRMREDKLRSMWKAMYYSYQAAIVQKYVPSSIEEQPYFRCLINHDKLKVDYEDKIISIPFEEPAVDPSTMHDVQVVDNKRHRDDNIETGFTNGTVFKWVHGNKEEWVPDTYWIVYIQYSEETAYFRGEIRRADEEIIVIDDDGNKYTYRGWMTGPDETSIQWNVKKGVIWNDMNYTKQLFITKDPTTKAFFQRFDRVTINGQPWEIQAYNDNYGNSATNKDTGIIRVALKETYTATDDKIAAVQVERSETPAAAIEGPEVLAPYDEVIYSVPIDTEGSWSLSAKDGLVEMQNVNDFATKIKVITTKVYRKGFDLKFGNLSKHIIIKTV